MKIFHNYNCLLQRNNVITGKSLLKGTYVIHVLSASLRDLKFFCNLGIYFIIKRPMVVKIESHYNGL